jgi:hypothetical protein
MFCCFPPAVTLYTDDTCPSELQNQENVVYIVQAANKGIITLDFKQNGDYYISSAVSCYVTCHMLSTNGMQSLLAVPTYVTCCKAAFADAQLPLSASVQCYSVHSTRRSASTAQPTACSSCWHCLPYFDLLHNCTCSSLTSALCAPLM